MKIHLFGMGTTISRPIPREYLGVYDCHVQVVAKVEERGGSLGKIFVSGDKIILCVPLRPQASPKNGAYSYELGHVICFTLSLLCAGSMELHYDIMMITLCLTYLFSPKFDRLYT